MALFSFDGVTLRPMEQVDTDIRYFLNEQAIRAYEKVGFQKEGACRQAVLRDGKKYDLVIMGILREEWAGA